MTKRQTLSVAALAVGLILAAAPAFAKGEGGYICQTYNASKGGPPVTHCITWTRLADGRMHANCDPSKMDGTAMRAACADMEAHPEQPAANG
jgi:hypothetical protein